MAQYQAIGQRAPGCHKEVLGVADEITISRDHKRPDVCVVIGWNATGSVVFRHELGNGPEPTITITGMVVANDGQ